MDAARAGVSGISLGAGPTFKLTEGFVTQKFSSDSRRGRVLKMTQTRQTLEEVDLVFDGLLSIIIHRDMKQFQSESAPLPERVITGLHQTETDSWSSSSPLMLFETQQPPMVLQTVPITPDGSIDPHTI